MSRWEDELVDVFLAEVPEDEVDALVGALDEPVSPPPSLRASILDGAMLEGRFDRFRAAAAELLEIGEERAGALLDGIGRAESWGPSPVPWIELYHVEGGPSVADAITGFVRLPAGSEFPLHRHLGDEAVLLVQGSLEDSVTGRVFRPGDVVRMPAGTEHGFTVRPGPGLVYLAVLHQGIQIGELVLGPDDPRM